MIKIISVLTTAFFPVSEGKFNINLYSRKTPSASSPGTGTVGDKKAEKTADQYALYDVIGRNRFHCPALGHIEQSETDGCPDQDGEK